MRVGDVELVPVFDARGSGPLVELWPDVELADWELYRPLYPELFEGDRWSPPVMAYVIRSAGRTVLVDTGVGDYQWIATPQVTGQLLPNLADHGLSPDDPDLVFVTHVHLDHVGTNAAFARPRFAFHADALAAAQERTDSEHLHETVLPLIAAGRSDAIEDGAELAPGVVAVALDGHDPGHMGVRLGSEALLIADAAAHPAMFDRPEWQFIADADHERSVATRQAIVEETVDTGMLVVSGHFPGSGIGRLVREDGLVKWQEARSA
jgi:glyoxylase-like metal-dependent hydrolase (beta-lactamase superfamily II)